MILDMDTLRCVRFLCKSVLSNTLSVFAAANTAPSLRSVRARSFRHGWHAVEAKGRHALRTEIDDANAIGIRIGNVKFAVGIAEAARLAGIFVRAYGT